MTNTRRLIAQLIAELLDQMPEINADVLIVNAMYEAAKRTRRLNMSDEDVRAGLAELLEELQIGTKAP